MVMWENVAYLVSDERRLDAYRALKKTIGLRPRDILRATQKELLAVARMGGMHPVQRVEKLRRTAEVALAEFGDDVRAFLALPPRGAKRKLMKFPGIGEPGAEKILLFCGAAPVLALDSNGVRVLLRLGFGEKKKSYAATYRAAQAAASAGVTTDGRWLARAHLLLRRHGKTLCKTSEPLCGACPLASGCSYAHEHGHRGTGGRIG
jgi:endonuclease-3